MERLRAWGSRIWRALSIWSTLATFGAAAVVVVVARSVIRLPWPWFVVLGVGIVLLGLSLVRRWQWSVGFTVRPRAYFGSLHLDVTNTGSTSEFEATVLRVEIPGEERDQHPQWQILWTDEPARRCEIPSGALHNLLVGNANGEEVDGRPGRYGGTVECFRPNPVPASLFRAGDPLQFVFVGQEIRIHVRIDRIKPAKSITRTYLIQFEASDLRAEYAGRARPTFEEVVGSSAPLTTNF